MKSGVAHRFSSKFPGFFLIMATWVNYKDGQARLT
jgi:hypothetical protein